MSKLPALTTNAIILQKSMGKDEESQLANYHDWLNKTGRVWSRPELDTYRDYLLYEHENKNTRETGLSPATVSAHLTHIRRRYRQILDDREYLYSFAPDNLSPADRFAVVEEITKRLLIAINPENAPVRNMIKQDRPDEQFIRLTPEQASDLLSQPDRNTPKGYRDYLVLLIGICTGLREAEIANLRVADLRSHAEGNLALFVRKGKRAKQRQVLYGELDWILKPISTWTKEYGLKGEDYVIKGFLGWSSEKVAEGGITPRTIQRITEAYPIEIYEQTKSLTPHDLRRTYARMQYKLGMPVPAIRKNLGHTHVETTWRYIGDVDVEERLGRDWRKLQES